jgi:predicted dehydrogenase
MVVTIAIVGAGQRGKGYARFAKENPHLAKVVSVAEPRQWHRDFIKSEHNLEPSACFEDWKALAATGKKVADAVVIATLDREHKAPALAFAALGYANP